MLAIKLKIVGRKNQRTFRIIVQEARAKLDGKFVEDIGWYNPHTNQFKINKERVDYWIDNGAQPTIRVSQILKKSSGEDTAQTYSVRGGRKKKKTKDNDGSLPDAGAKVQVNDETKAQTGVEGGVGGHKEKPQAQVEVKKETQAHANTETLEEKTPLRAGEESQTQTNSDPTQTDPEVSEKEVPPINSEQVVEKEKESQ